MDEAGWAGDTHRAAKALAESLVTLSASRRLSVTWVNHYSFMVALRDARDDLHRMDVVGVDGKLLQWIVRAPNRTSADTVVPLLLERHPAPRVALIGGSPESVEGRLSTFEKLVGANGSVTANIDGFGGIESPDRLVEQLRTAEPNIVLIGLGAGLQEQMADLVKQHVSSVSLSVTVGGYLDQASHVAYYPRFAYALRLNWLVRLLREPKRLWRRYSLDAMRAIMNGRWLRREYAALPGSQFAAALAKSS